MAGIKPCRRCGRTPVLIPYEESTDGNHDKPAKVVCPCGNKHILTWGEFSRARESVTPEKRGSGYMSRDEIEAISAVVVEAWNGEQSAGAETELLPCPFCGSNAELVRNSSGSYFARCTNRQCAAKTRLYHENENGARIAWNKRAGCTCHPGAVNRAALLELAYECASYDGSGWLAKEVMHNIANRILEAMEAGR